MSTSPGTKAGAPSVLEIARRARQAALELAPLSTEIKNAALRTVREQLSAREAEIVAANRADREDARREVDAGRMSRPLFQRLDLEGRKLAAALAGLADVERLEDPVGVVSLTTRLDDGLELRRVSCPLGVIGVIFEARPEAAVQIAALCMKSANAVILKGGSEAHRTNVAVVDVFREALAKIDGFPVDAVQLVSTREEVREMLALDRYIDLIIPRGSNELVQSIQDSTRIPVLGHADGICSVYIDRDADVERAARIVLDSKTHYPAACNAVETLLVHRDAVGRVLPEVARRLDAAGVELRADSTCRGALVASLPQVAAAVPSDFDTEFLDLVLAVRAVDDVDQAIAHINEHGSHHTDAIVTEDPETAERFLARVDSAGVYHNASTRFADGFRYGLGAEVGISTNKTHARGPVGLEGLTIYKYRLTGSGQVAADYDPGGRSFQHRSIEG